MLYTLEDLKRGRALLIALGKTPEEAEFGNTAAILAHLLLDPSICGLPQWRGRSVRHRFSARTSFAPSGSCDGPGTMDCPSTRAMQTDGRAAAAADRPSVMRLDHPLCTG